MKTNAYRHRTARLGRVQAADHGLWNQLHSRLLAQVLAACPERSLTMDLIRADQDAVTLAWMSGFPLLFFPVLLEEKVEEALRRARRQKNIHRRSRRIKEVLLKMGEGAGDSG